MSWLRIRTPLVHSQGSRILGPAEDSFSWLWPIFVPYKSFTVAIKKKKRKKKEFASLTLCKIALQSIDVMDYSLLVGVDKEKHELVLGIIDFMRQYTWDKHLETWVKTTVILGGARNSTPTVISPMQYKKRFRKAMSTYFLMVPDQWSPPTIIPSRSQSDLAEDNLQGTSLEWYGNPWLYMPKC